VEEERVKRVVCAGVVASVAFCGLFVGVGTAASAATNGTVTVYVTPHNTTTPKHPGKVLLAGAIGDYGVVMGATSQGKPTGKKKSVYRLLKLKKGSILVDISTFQSKLNSAFTSPSTFNMTTCSFSASATGAISVVKGTGSYEGMTGTFAMTGYFGGLGPRTKSGKCTTKTTTPALATHESIVGTGDVTIP
jgi:hypothetical protein